MVPTRRLMECFSILTCPIIDEKHHERPSTRNHTVNAQWTCKLSNKMTAHARHPIWVQGHGVVNGLVLSADELVQWLVAQGAHLSLEALRAALLELDGFFCIVVKQAGEIWAAVDRIRSIPFFYAPQVRCCGDAVDDVLDEGAPWVLDKRRVQQLALTRYTTDGATLVNGLSQVPAGTLVQLASKGPVLHTWFSFSHEGAIEDEEAHRQLDTAFQTMLEAVQKHWEGRQIILPLTGGMDSHLLGIWLRRLGFKDVVAFTLGRSSDQDVRGARRRAADLGFRWVHCRTPRRRESALGKDPTLAHLRPESNLTSVAAGTDIMAFRTLVEEKHVNKDAVVLPGHALDFIAGSHINARLANPSSTFDDARDTAYEKEHKLHPSWCVDTEIEGALIELIREEFEAAPTQRTADIYEWWVWRNRQSNYISNQVRNIEAVGLNWFMPYWCQPFLDVMRRLSVKQRYERKWVSAYYSALLQTEQLSAQVPDATPWHQMIVHRLDVAFDSRVARYSPKQVLKNLHFYRTLFGRFSPRGVLFHSLSTGDYLRRIHLLHPQIKAVEFATFPEKRPRNME
ncbi:MAG: hypothetical protein GY822_09800 [Deltaproteobacteria bacterium]|nr:hypothetical protein [Deltaproteobacteria bacterium]